MSVFLKNSRLTILPSLNSSVITKGTEKTLKAGQDDKLSLSQKFFYDHESWGFATGSLRS